MYVVVVDLVIRPEHANAFRQAVLVNAAASLDLEPGCRQFDVALSPQQPTQVLLYELYDDEAAFGTHLRSAHFAAFDATTRAWVESKAVRTFELVKT